MAVEDRNVSRNSRLADSGITAQLPALPVEDIDTPIWVGRINHPVALAGMVSSAALVAVADCLVRACVAPNLSAMGELDIPILSVGADLATLAHSGFYQNVNGTPALIVAGVVALPAFTIATGRWGVVTMQVAADGTVTAKPASLNVMSYPSADVAYGAAPAPDLDPAAVNDIGDPIPQGVASVVVIQAAFAADFVGATSLLDTDTAAVESLGRPVMFSNLPAGASAWPVRNDDMRLFATSPSKAFVDRTGLRKAFSLPAHINGAGETIREGDLICLTARGSSGASAVTLPATATLHWRPFPMQGEGYQSGTASATR